MDRSPAPGTVCEHTLLEIAALPHEFHARGGPIPAAPVDPRFLGISYSISEDHRHIKALPGTRNLAETPFDSAADTLIRSAQTTLIYHYL